MKYYRPKPLEWVYPVHRGYKLACCDCGLVHNFDFGVVKEPNGRNSVRFRVTRNNRATALMRRHKEKAK